MLANLVKLVIGNLGGSINGKEGELTRSCVKYKRRYTAGMWPKIVDQGLQCRRDSKADPSVRLSRSARKVKLPAQYLKTMTVGGFGLLQAEDTEREIAQNVHQHLKPSMADERFHVPSVEAQAREGVAKLHSPDVRRIKLVAGNKLVKKVSARAQSGHV